jgi:U3 small nucleolar RNA-associated protein 14
MEDSNGAENSKIKASSGRRVFGAAKIQAPESRDVTKTDNFYANSDSDDDLEVKENIVDMGKDRSSDMQKDVHVDSVLPHEDSEIRQDSVFKVTVLL